MLDLTSDQVADAEAAGVSFPPAAPHHVQRLSMHRKVFRIDGEAVLATRDGALFETAATLGRLIAEGERRRRDLAAWEAAVAGPPAEAPPQAPQSRSRPGPRATEPPPERRPAPPTPPRPRATEAAEPRRAPPRGERWLTAGAERRGRLAQHWSRRRA